MMAARYARERLDGHAVVNRQTGARIGLDWERGLKNATAPGLPPMLLLAVPAIPAMLAAARYLGALAPRPPYPPHVLRYHAFAAGVEVGGRRVDAVLIVQEDRQHRLYLDRVLGGEARPQRDAGGANPDAPSSTMGPADDAAEVDGPAAPVSTAAAPSAGDNATSAPPPLPQNEGWFHSLLASVGLAGSGDKGPPAPTAPSDDQKSVNYPPPPPPKPAFSRVPDFDEQGFPNYLPGDPYPRYEPTRPPPEPGIGERAWDGFEEGLRQSDTEDVASKAFNYVTTPIRAGFGAVEGALDMPQGAIMDVLPGIVGADAPHVPEAAPPAVLENIAEGKPAAAAGPETMSRTAPPQDGERTATPLSTTPSEGPLPVGAPRVDTSSTAPPLNELGVAARERPSSGSVGSDAAPEGPPTALRGPSGEESTQGSLPYYDRLDDFEQYRREAGRDGSDPLSVHGAARAYVMRRQVEGKAEHIAAYDADANAITHVGTSLEKDEVSLPPGLEPKLTDPDARITLHHSHSDSAGLSRGDISVFSYPGVGWIAGHGIGDELAAARLTPIAREALARPDEAGQRRAQNILQNLWDRAEAACRAPMDEAVGRGEFTEEEGRRIRMEVINRGLADAGVTEYVTSHSLPSRPVVEQMKALANAQLRMNVPRTIPELANYVPDSRTEPVGIRQGMARISREDDEAAAKRPVRAGGGRISAGRTWHSQRQDYTRGGDGSASGTYGRSYQVPSGAPSRTAQDETGQEVRPSVPRASGADLEMPPTSYGHLIILAARYARLRLDGHAVVNRETRVPIALTWERGLKEIVAPGTPPEMLLAVPAIPGMLAGARYLGSAPDPLRRPDIANVHGFASAVEVGGRRIDVVMVVRQNRQGRLFLDRMERCAVAGARAAQVLMV
ncbi:MAG TPA: hypothetical protein VGP50_08005 [Stellaceae bacterium]|nr:hypothetical protein [Stellaceae bacterium]